MTPKLAGRSDAKVFAPTCELCEPTYVRLTAGNGGWIRVDDIEEAIGPVYVRLAIDELTRRWRAVDIYLDGCDKPIAGRVVRQLPVAAIEAAASEPHIRDELQRRFDLPAVPLAVLASHFATTYDSKGDSKGEGWVADALRGCEPTARAEQVASPDFGDAPVPPLSTPPGGRLTDEFLESVARCYRAAVRERKRPGPELASQAGVPVRTVQHWVYLARQRGILAPGRPGVAG